MDLAYLDEFNVPGVLAGSGGIEGGHVASLRDWESISSTSLPGWAVLGGHALLVVPLLLEIVTGILSSSVLELHPDLSLSLIAFCAFSVLDHALAGDLQLLVEVNSQELLGEFGILAFISNTNGIGADVKSWQRSTVDHELEPVLDVSGSEVVGQGDPVGPGGSLSDLLDDSADHPLAAPEEHAFAVLVNLSAK